MCISTNDVDTEEVKDYLLTASYNTGKTIVNQFIIKKQLCENQSEKKYMKA